jgi:hypothetical protein
MNTDKKLGLGSMLAVFGAFGIIIFPILGWSKVPSPWDFILGFLFGVSSGAGVALAIHAMIQKRTSSSAR